MWRGRKAQREEGERSTGRDEGKQGEGGIDGKGGGRTNRATAGPGEEMRGGRVRGEGERRRARTVLRSMPLSSASLMPALREAMAFSWCPAPISIAPMLP